MSLLNGAPFSKNSNTPTIFDQFPELNQGKQYLQKQAKVTRQIAKTQKFIEAFTSYNATDPGPRARGRAQRICSDQVQSTKNKHLPCRCGTTTCTSTTPYCNYQLNSCMKEPVKGNELYEDWAVNSACPGDGEISSCNAPSGCPNYGYCPQGATGALAWEQDVGPTTFNNMQSQITTQKGEYQNYIDQLNQWVAEPPPCSPAGPNACSAQNPYYGRNVVVERAVGPAPFGPGHLKMTCPLEVCTECGDGGSGGSAAVSKAGVGIIDSECHEQPLCVGFGKKGTATGDGVWEYLKWNTTGAYVGAGNTDKQMRDPSDYPGFFYIQKPTPGQKLSDGSIVPCNQTTCCGFKYKNNCKYDQWETGCATPPPPVNGGWSKWTPACSKTVRITQTRTCNNPTPENNGKQCTGPTEQLCAPIPLDGGWSNWTPCPAPLGQGGTQSRACNSPVPMNGGKQCTGPPTQPCALDGGWSDWTACPTPVGSGGKQTRQCNSPAPANGGKQCSGPSTKPCSLFGTWGKWSGCSVSKCGETGVMTRTCSGGADPPGNCPGVAQKSCATPPCYTPPPPGSWSCAGVCPSQASVGAPGYTADCHCMYEDKVVSISRCTPGPNSQTYCPPGPPPPSPGTWSDWAPKNCPRGYDTHSVTRTRECVGATGTGGCDPTASPPCSDDDAATGECPTANAFCPGLWKPEVPAVCQYPCHTGTVPADTPNLGNQCWADGSLNAWLKAHGQEGAGTDYPGSPAQYCRENGLAAWKNAGRPDGNTAVDITTSGFYDTDRYGGYPSGGCGAYGDEGGGPSFVYVCPEPTKTRCGMDCTNPDESGNPPSPCFDNCGQDGDSGYTGAISNSAGWNVNWTMGYNWG